VGIDGGQTDVNTVSAQRYFIAGGAGFIGSGFVDRLLAMPDTQLVTVFDNFSSGRMEHLESHRHDVRLRIIREDIKNVDALTEAMRDHEVIIHLASNPDIARAAEDPTVDFDEGTLLTHNVIEAVRRSKARSIIYASGSGVYGDLGETEAREDAVAVNPISTYGASKLAGEAIIAAYCHMFDFHGYAFRFGNVVGPRQTHGVGYDFIRSLRENSTRLRILGDGSQSKSYVHVDDVIDGVLLALASPATPFVSYNVATGDYITVREIADLAVECIGTPPEEVSYEFTGGNRGWKGDVPIVRLNTDRIRALGWRPRYGSHDALRRSMAAMLPAVEEARP
jgi:UDP-glucose 4-epimerase